MRKIINSCESTVYPIAIRLIETDFGYMVETDYNKEEPGKSTTSKSFKEFAPAMQDYMSMWNAIRNDMGLAG